MNNSLKSDQQQKDENSKGSALTQLNLLQPNGHPQQMQQNQNGQMIQPLMPVSSTLMGQSGDDLGPPPHMLNSFNRNCNNGGPMMRSGNNFDENSNSTPQLFNSNNFNRHMIRSGFNNGQPFHNNNRNMRSFYYNTNNNHQLNQGQRFYMNQFQLNNQLQHDQFAMFNGFNNSHLNALPSGSANESATANATNANSNVNISEYIDLLETDLEGEAASHKLSSDEEDENEGVFSLADSTDQVKPLSVKNKSKLALLLSDLNGMNENEFLKLFRIDSGGSNEKNEFFKFIQDRGWNAEDKVNEFSSLNLNVKIKDALAAKKRDSTDESKFLTATTSESSKLNECLRALNETNLISLPKILI